MAAVLLHDNGSSEQCEHMCCAGTVAFRARQRRRLQAALIIQKYVNKLLNLSTDIEPVTIVHYTLLMDLEEINGISHFAQTLYRKVLPHRTVEPFLKRIFSRGLFPSLRDKMRVY